MKTTPRRATRRRIARGRGVALIALVAVIALSASWAFVSRLNSMSADFAAAKRARNALVLSHAKQALLGHIALQAAKSGEDDPGRLPCPESPGSAGTALEGANGTCSAGTAIGRFPWRTVGMDKPIDADAEPLWLVVSSGWFKVSGTNLTINSDSTGALNVDDVSNAAVALIIAPGAPLGGQARTSTNPSYDNYIESYNSGTSKFTTTGASDSFNDQVVVITVADIMPGLEAAIARRIEREIVPALKTVYTPATWGFAGASPVYPFAAPFANPGPGTGTSDYQGTAGTYQGLLPFNQTQGCTADVTNPRCLTSLISWSGVQAIPVETLGFGYIAGGTLPSSPSCTETADTRQCAGYYHENDATPSQPIRVQMTTTLANVAMGLRALDTTKLYVEARNDVVTDPWLTQTVTLDSATMNTNGSVTLVFSSTLPNIDTMGWGTYAEFRMRIERSAIADHALLSTTNATTGWFARNGWYRQLYYAVSQGHTAGTLPPSCTTGTTCLSVTNGDADTVYPITAGGQHAILILAGRSINGSVRPSSNRGDYLEFDNLTATGAAVLPFERQPVKPGAVADATMKSPFNDRVVVVGTN